MNDEATGKQKPNREQERELQAGRGQRRDEPQGKTEREKKLAEWRGSGVCGDRHTD